MKKKLCLALCIALAMLALVACGSSEKGIVGKWESTDQAGVFIEFTKGGEMKFDVADGVDSTISSGVAVMQLADITYEIKSDTEFEMTISALGQTNTVTMGYTLDGDTLTLEGAEYTRK